LPKLECQHKQTKADITEALSRYKHNYRFFDQGPFNL